MFVFVCLCISCERYIVKSCTHREFQTLLRMGECYRDHVTATENKHTFLSRIYGAHSLKLYHAKVYFIVQENLFNLPQDEVMGTFVSEHE